MRPRDWLLIPLLVALAIAGVIWGGKNAYVSLHNRSPLQISCADYAAHPPDSQWIRLIDCVPDAHQLGVESRGGGAVVGADGLLDDVTAVYIPLRAPTARLGEPAKILMSIDDGPLLDLGNPHPSEATTTLAGEIFSRPIEGLVELGVDRSEKRKKRLRDLNLNVEHDFAILAYGDEPRPLALGLGALGIGLGAIVLLVRGFRRRRKDRVELARATIVATLLALAACRGDPPQKQTESRVGSGSAIVVAPGSAAVPAGSAVPANDPWARPTVSESVAELACPTVTAAYFYRVEKEGKTSHLLGTRHLGIAWRKMPPVVHETLRAAKLVVFETVDDDGSKEKPAKQKSAREEAGPELWERYRKLAGETLAEEVEDDPPIRALLLLAVRYEDRLTALENEIKLDAIEAKIPMRGLETNAFQQTLIDRYLNGRAFRAFVQQLDSLDELRQDTIDDLTKYCNGTDDTPGVDEKGRKDMLEAGYTAAEIDRQDKEMLFDRNARWIPKLEPILAEGGAFIAVGADHLRGDQGVPALLEKAGYQVTRMTPPKPAP